MDKRKLLFALVPVVTCAILLVVSGFEQYAWTGLIVCVAGAADFLFTYSSVEGMVASEVYGDAGESLWEFRSFALMIAGPFISFYAAFLL